MSKWIIPKPVNIHMDNQVSRDMRAKLKIGWGQFLQVCTITKWEVMYVAEYSGISSNINPMYAHLLVKLNINILGHMWNKFLKYDFPPQG